MAGAIIGILSNMSFDGKNDRNKLPLWMKTLFDTKAVDAWSEDPDYSQQSKESDTTGKLTLLIFLSKVY